MAATTGGAEGASSPVQGDHHPAASVQVVDLAGARGSMKAKARGGWSGLVDVHAVAEALGVKFNTVYKWARQGRMAGVYRLNGLWRFDLDEVLEWAAACRRRILEPR